MIKVLFISRGNPEGKIVPFIREQAESLKKEGLTVDYYVLNGKGIRGYMDNIKAIKQKIKSENYDLVHAHYTLSACIARWASHRKPFVVSFMGSDVNGIYNSKGNRKPGISFLLLLLSNLLVCLSDEAILKSPGMLKRILRKKIVTIIPNGVDLEKFYPQDKSECRRQLNLDVNKQYILFLGDQQDTVKNARLIINAVDQLEDSDTELLMPYPVGHELIPMYMNAADVLSISSFSEGSPNVVKEAMACNCPIVSTNVGDVAWLLEDVKGCYIATHEIQNYKDRISDALHYASIEKKTNGHQKLLDLKLDAGSISCKLISVYQRITNKYAKGSHHH